MAFSVLMSVYAREHPEYLGAALDSVMDQTMKPDEIVLVEDGKLTEELYQIIREKQKLYPCLKPVQLEENQQLGRALAIGLSHVSNELVARMDSDDISVRERFELQYQYMQDHPKTALVGGYIQEFDDQGSWDKIRQVPLDEKEIHRYMRYRNPLNHVTVMFRKEAILSAGNYQHFPYLEDYYLWNRLYANGAKLANIPKVLVKVRTSPNMFKRRGGFSYCAGYLRFRRIQKKLNITNTREYLLGCILSIAITLQPGWLRKWVYSAVLRRSGALEENG